MANVSFYICSTQSDITGYSNKTEGDLFFASSEGKIYRYNGSSLEEYGGSCRVYVKNTQGDLSSGQSQDVLYVNTYDKTLKIWSGSAYITLAQEVTTSVRAAGSATNTVIPTEAAVRTAIDNAVSGLTVDVSSSTSSANEGKAPQLDSDGMLPTTVIPAFAISEYVGVFTDWTTASASSDVVAAQKGDYLIISSGTSTPGADDGTWILSGNTPTSQSSWTQISTPDTNSQYTSGTGIEVTSAGVVNLQKATSSTIGGVKINGNNLSIANDGTLSATWRPVQVKTTAITTGNTLNLAEGSNVTLTATESNGVTTVSIAATDTTYSVATASTGGSGGTNGLLSATDKEKIDKGLTWQTISNS